MKSLVLSLLFFAPSVFAQTILYFVPDPNSPDRCFPYQPGEKLQVEITDTQVIFGGVTADGYVFTFADYIFENLNTGTFDSRYETPLGMINTEVTNTFDGVLLQHERDFTWPRKDYSLSAEFTNSGMILTDAISKERPLTCQFLNH